MDVDLEAFEEGRITYLYEGELTLIDRSTEFKEKMFNVCLFSFDQRGHFFDQSLLKELNNSIGRTTD